MAARFIDEPMAPFVVERMWAACTTGEEPTREPTIAKPKAGRLVRQVADQFLQLHGGTGYVEETRTARFFRDNRPISIGGGAAEVMLQVLAR
ncbi:MAG: citronellyl-CoA dehydrogenase [Paracrocinitomix sp.]